MGSNQRIERVVRDALRKTDDEVVERDPFGSIRNFYAENAGSVTADTVILSAQNVPLGETLEMTDIDIEGEGEVRVEVQESTDSGSSWSTKRQYKLASKGHLNISYEKPVEIVGSATTQMRAIFNQGSATRLSVGINGQAIESKT